MQIVGVDTYAEYLDYFQVHPEECALLFDMVLINVTSFFRGEAAWSYLAQEVVPSLIAAKPAGSPIRVWSAGCASGEEAYTLAIVFAEALGVVEFIERVKIYGTDIDEDALPDARLGSFDERRIRPVPEELRERYFDRTTNGWVFRRDLRRSVIFGRHDLTADAPISRLDLLACRNTLMYFNAEAQERILARFRFGLSPGGYLFLGKAETLLAHSASFRPSDLRHRVFQKAEVDGPVKVIEPAIDGDARRAGTDGEPPEQWAEAFRAAPTAQMIVDPGGVLVGAKRPRAHPLPHGVRRRRPQAAGPGALVPPGRAALADRPGRGERRPVEVADVEWSDATGAALALRVIVTPLDGGDGRRGRAGVTLTFIDETRHRQLEEELEASNRQLETAYEELQSTNEELETPNEELQSTNKELQSTNKEMHTVNEELRDRSQELNAANTYLASILTSLRSGVIVVNRDLMVRVWNRWFEEEWGCGPTR